MPAYASIGATTRATSTKGSAACIAVIVIAVAQTSAVWVLFQLNVINSVKNDRI